MLKAVVFIYMESIICKKTEVHIKIKNSKKNPDYIDPQRIFLPFTQLQDDITNGKGVGLGLSICKKYLKDHGGDIWLNQAKNWVEFIMSLPLENSSLLRKENAIHIESWHYSSTYHNIEKNTAMFYSKNHLLSNEEINFVSISKDFNPYIVESLSQKYRVIVSNKFDFSKKI